MANDVQPLPRGPLSVEKFLRALARTPKTRPKRKQKHYHEEPVFQESSSEIVQAGLHDDENFAGSMCNDTTNGRSDSHVETEELPSTQPANKRRRKGAITTSKAKASSKAKTLSKRPRPKNPRRLHMEGLALVPAIEHSLEEVAENSEQSTSENDSIMDDGLVSVARCAVWKEPANDGLKLQPLLALRKIMRPPSMTRRQSSPRIGNSRVEKRPQRSAKLHSKVRPTLCDGFEGAELVVPPLIRSRHKRKSPSKLPCFSNVLPLAASLKQLAIVKNYPQKPISDRSIIASGLEKQVNAMSVASNSPTYELCPVTVQPNETSAAAQDKRTVSTGSFVMQQLSMLTAPVPVRHDSDSDSDSRQKHAENSDSDNNSEDEIDDNEVYFPQRPSRAPSDPGVDDIQDHDWHQAETQTVDEPWQPGDARRIGTSSAWVEVDEDIDDDVEAQDEPQLSMNTISTVMLPMKPLPQGDVHDAES
ncbi:hypothetical protein LTS18_006850, partial [Coniosporium uncinatum]